MGWATMFIYKMHLLQGGFTKYYTVYILWLPNAQSTLATNEISNKKLDEKRVGFLQHMFDYSL